LTTGTDSVAMTLRANGNIQIGGTFADNGYKFQNAGNSVLAGQVVQGGGTQRSTAGTTIAFTGGAQTIFSTNSDCGDGGRFLSIVNENTSTDAFSALSFRVNPGGGGNNAMLDIKFVNLSNGANLSNLIWTFLHNGSFVDRMNLSSNGRLTVQSNILTGELRATGQTELAYQSGNVLIGTLTGTGDKLRVDGNTFTNTITTYRPGVNVIKSDAWKLGRASIGTQPTETHQITVEIGGALYTIGAAQI
jgi:hypothetical protein